MTFDYNQFNLILPLICLLMVAVIVIRSIHEWRNDVNMEDNLPQACDVNMEATLPQACDTALPFGQVVESGGGLQCCCPNCEYGSGDQDTFIAGFSEATEHTCSKCGTVYLTLRIAKVPESGRSGW